MEKQTCYTWVENVIEMARDDFAGALVLDEEKFASLRSTCMMIDEMMDEFECESYDVQVEYETQNLVISFSCLDMVMENGRNHKFFHVAKRATSLNVVPENEDCMTVSFIFGGLWIPESADE